MFQKYIFSPLKTEIKDIYLPLSSSSVDSVIAELELSTEKSVK